jgi:hypothetical protein
VEAGGAHTEQNGEKSNGAKITVSGSCQILKCAKEIIIIIIILMAWRVVLGGKMKSYILPLNVHQITLTTYLWTLVFIFSQGHSLRFELFCYFLGLIPRSRQLLTEGDGPDGFPIPIMRDACSVCRLWALSLLYLYLVMLILKSYKFSQISR